jgi:hypothetical protein
LKKDQLCVMRAIFLALFYFYKVRSYLNAYDTNAKYLIYSVGSSIGADDKVVLPNQATMMFEAVTAKKIPAAIVIFDGMLLNNCMLHILFGRLNCYCFFLILCR